MIVDCSATIVTFIYLLKQKQELFIKMLMMYINSSLLQLAYLSKSIPTGNMLVKRLVEDLDRQMSEISAHEDALMGQVSNIYKYLLIYLFVHGTLLKINGK